MGDLTKCAVRIVEYQQQEMMHVCRVPFQHTQIINGKGYYMIYYDIIYSYILLLANIGD